MRTVAYYYNLNSVLCVIQVFTDALTPQHPVQIPELRQTDRPVTVGPIWGRSSRYPAVGLTIAKSVCVCVCKAHVGHVRHTIWVAQLWFFTSYVGFFHSSVALAYSLYRSSSYKYVSHVHFQVMSHRHLTPV